MIYEYCALTCDHLPVNKPRYLMGVWYTWDLGLRMYVYWVSDMFECVDAGPPLAMEGNAMLFTTGGVINIDNKKWVI
jgi:queuine tRNA-ribosyltransferase